MSRIRPLRAARRPSRKLLDIMLAAAFLALVGLIAARFDRFETRRATGQATVNDGDSITLNGERIRLRDIDAPELDQTCQRDGEEYACGRSSKAALVALVGGQPVECRGWERDRFDRLLAVCSAGGRELNLGQVEAGWAIAFGGYDAAERKARDARAGLWAGSFERPRDWRDRQGSLAEPAHGLFQALLNLLRELFRF